MPANRAALAINLVPAVALVSGALVLGESLGPVQLAGCAIIVGAVLYAETGQPSSAQVPAARSLPGEPVPEAE